MTPRQVSLIRQSFSHLVQLEAQVASIFYAKLFRLDPSLRPLFKGDMTEQGRKLMKVLGVVVASADRLDDVIPTVRGLGKRHVGYGVTEAHYQTVGQALIATLQEGLGEMFTDELREAWTLVYVTLSNAMIDAARVHLHAQQMERKMERQAASIHETVAHADQAERTDRTGRVMLWSIVAAATVAVFLAKYLATLH